MQVTNAKSNELLDNSFRMIELNKAYFHSPWHTHSQVELTLITHGRGIRYVGDSINSFRGGDLILLGPGLPHCWHTDSDMLVSSQQEFSGVCIQLDESFMGDDFLNRPELSIINSLFRQSMNGIRFYGITYDIVKEKIKSMDNQDKFDRFITLLSIFQTLASSDEFELLSDSNFFNSSLGKVNERMKLVYNYVINNFKKDIKLEKIAGMMEMNPSSFCRYFRSKSGKTFFSFVNEFKIAHASILLSETSKEVSVVCQESGFNNVAHFNRQFLKLTGQNPLRFRKNSQKLNLSPA